MNNISFSLLFSSLPPNRSTFACPLCSKTNLDCSGLVKHCNERHKNDHSQVVSEREKERGREKGTTILHVAIIHDVLYM